MSKFHRRENLYNSLPKDEDVINEQETAKETETAMPIMTSESKIDLSPESLGNVQLECNRCHDMLVIGRYLSVNLLCPKCGCDQFTSQSNFHMQSLDNERTVRVGDTVKRGHYLVWKIV